MKRYEFKVILCGYGKNEDEAWEDAIEGFIEDPGSLPEQDDIEEFDEEE